MNKIVDGQEEAMGTFTCAVEVAQRTLRCPMRDWIWTFQANTDTFAARLPTRRA